MGIGRIGVIFSHEGIEGRLPGLLNANNPLLIGGLEEDMRVMIGRLVYDVK